MIDCQGIGQAAGIGGGKNGDSDSIEIYGGEVKAYGANPGGGAGIGSGVDGNSGNIIIGERADIKAVGGSTGGAGIGSGMNGYCTSITINGGTVEAIGYAGAAGIGAGSGHRCRGKITITGGYVEAIGGNNNDGNGGAGIGGGGNRYDGFAGGDIIISGGYVKADGGSGKDNDGDGIGNGGGFTGTDLSTFSTGDAGKAIIFATAGGESGAAIYDQSGKEHQSWRGIIFENGVGGVYGDQSLQHDLTIKDGESLNIPGGTVFTVPADVVLTNNGVIDGEGTLIGDVKGNKPSGSIDDGKVEIVVNSTAGGTVSGGGRYLPGADVVATATPVEGYHFVAWKEDDVLLSRSATYSFKADDDRTLTAIFAAHSGGAASCLGSAVCETCGEAYGELGAHDLHHHDAVAAGCETAGNVEYWHCVVCGKNFADANGGQEIADVTVAASGHALTYQPRVAPSYSATGMAAHYACARCGALFLDEAAEQAVSAAELVIPKLERPPFVPSEPSTPDPEPDPTPEQPEEMPLPFKDVADESWYRDAVGTVYAQGLMTGVAEDAFAPELPASRGMVVSILHRLSGSPATNAAIFDDVSPDDWYGQAVAWAAQAGIANGTSTDTFSPNAAVTREQLAALLCNYAAQQGLDTTARSELSTFEDAASVSAWARESVSWATAEGLLSGISATMLAPQGEATRAQLAAMLVRFSELLQTAA